MGMLKRVSRVVILSLLAGSACSASEELPKTSAVKEASSVKTLQAGIELVSAGTGSEQRHGPSVLFYLDNPRGQTVNVLKWNTPLEEELSADVFLVARNGKPVDYLGRMVKRGSPQKHDYVDVPAGGRIESTVDIGRYYDIAEPGAYTIAYKPLQVTSQEDSQEDSRATSQTESVVQLNQETLVTMSTDSLTFTVSQ